MPTLESAWGFGGVFSIRKRISSRRMSLSLCFDSTIYRLCESPKLRLGLALLIRRRGRTTLEDDRPRPLLRTGSVGAGSTPAARGPSARPLVPLWAGRRSGTGLPSCSPRVQIPFRSTFSEPPTGPYRLWFRANRSRWQPKRRQLRSFRHQAVRLVELNFPGPRSPVD